MPDFSNILMVTDLDGTFFGCNSRLVPENLEAIDYFKAHGGHFTTATGRIHSNVAEVIPHCASLFNAPAITSNGALIYDYAAGQIVEETPMNPQAVIRLVAMAEQLNPGVAARISTPDGFLMHSRRINEMLDHDLRYYRGSAQNDILPLEDWNTHEARWYKMVIRGAYEDLCQIRPQIEAAFGGIFEYSASSPTFFEIQAGGCTKATAMKRLAQMLCPIEGGSLLTVAVGDHENDLAMLSAADISACPSNALDAVKTVAKWQLCHHDQGCIAELIRKLEE